MEKKLEENIKIVYIDRKKNNYIKDKFDKIKENFFIRNIQRLYFDDNILFKILYDKIYRPSFYNFLINSDREKINPNVTKNIFKMNEDKLEFQFQKIQQFENNLLSLSNEKFNDDEIFGENNILLSMNKVFLKERLAKYSSFFFCVLSLFFKFALKKPFATNITFVLISINLGYIYYIRDYKQNSLRTETYKFMKKKYDNEIEIYKKYYN
jgi:hypothetical protein